MVEERNNIPSSFLISLKCSTKQHCREVIAKSSNKISW